MKKIVRILCLVAMVALVATSCRKKVENTNVTVVLEETAGFEAGPSFDGSKAYLDPNDYSFRWNDNDEIAFYNLSSNYTESTCTKLTAVSGSEGSRLMIRWSLQDRVRSVSRYWSRIRI